MSYYKQLKVITSVTIMAPPFYLRSGKKWTIPELITLQREHELLELPIHEIAQRHERTSLAITARLESEGFVSEVEGDSNRMSEASCKGKASKSKSKLKPLRAYKN